MKSYITSYMKKFSSSIGVVCFCVALSGQNTRIANEKVYVDGYVAKPTFQGQDANGFKKWVDERIVFDPEARAEGIRGRVTLQFTVEADGSVDNVKLMRGLDPRLDAEAVRVVSSSPKWEWHVDNPKPCTYTFSVIFKDDTPNPYPFDEFEYNGFRGKEKLRIYSVSHGSIVITIPSLSIFIDPVMNLGGKKLTYGWFKGNASSILLTHEHGDHLCKDAVDYLTRGARFDLFGNRKAIEILGQGTVLNNGDTVSVKYGKVHIKAVPAYNTTKDHLKFHPKGNGNGYLIEIGGLVIYVAGDTEVIPEMKELGKVDIALLPVNQPYTMTPDQCIRAAKIIHPKVLIPYHMGDTDMTPVLKTFEHSDIKVIFHEELR